MELRWDGLPSLADGLRMLKEQAQRTPPEEVVVTMYPEALARWRHPTRGYVPPSAFIPVAEETRLIVPLGRVVLDTACEQAVQWRRAWPNHPLRISVNLSPRQFAQPDLVAQEVRQQRPWLDVGLHPV